MDFLVMLEESPDRSLQLARVDSVPAMLTSERRGRDVVTLYGTPNSESLALALAAAVESHRDGQGSEGFRHLGVWADRGAVGDAAWRDQNTGDLVTRDLLIPLEVLSATAHRLLGECGNLLQRLLAGLTMPDWPEGAWRAINVTLDTAFMPARTSVGTTLDGMLDIFREADGLTFEVEGD
jgi:hypothetical protein